MNGPLLELRAVTRRYTAGAAAVNQLSLSVAEGEICAILGPSGAGKTTLLRLIAGFEQPDGGAVLINGDLVSSSAETVPPESRGIGVVFQHGALFPHLTVRKNVEFGLRRRSPVQREERWKLLSELCGLAELSDRYPHELSGGEQQRVALARALAPEFPLVLLDEPLSNVDPLRREALGADVRRILTATGTTAVFVTHDQHEAFTLADRVAVMRNGTLEQIGTPAEVYRTPASAFVASFVGHATFLHGECHDGRVSTEIGSFADLRGRREGTPVTVPVRPGDCDLEDAIDGDCIVETATFAGDHWICSVRLPSGQALRCDVDAAPRTPICGGTRVRVVPRIRAAVTFDER